MYCVKTEPGRERIRVRSISSGFIPTYISAAPGAGKGRELVVPGYIFTLVKTGLASKVPEDEWRVIEALSDHRLSTVDPDGRLVEGPLKGLEELVSRTDLKNSALKIAVKLLNEQRTYWIRVRIASPEPEKADSEQVPPVEEPVPEKSTGEDAEKPGKTGYTQEQIREALKRAEEIGIHAAGKELGIPWQSVLAWARKAKAVKENADLPAPKKKKVNKPGSPEALKAENAMLRKQVAELNKEVERLKKALAQRG